jgi:hypothetical protein
VKKLAQKSKPSPPKAKYCRLDPQNLPAPNERDAIWYYEEPQGLEFRVQIGEKIYRFMLPKNRLVNSTERVMNGDAPDPGKALWLMRRKATERRPTKRQTKATAPPPAQKGK